MISSLGVGAQLLESLTTGGFFAALFLFTVGSFIIDFLCQPRYPKSIPRIGFGDGVINSVRNWIGYVSSYNGWVLEGYEKHSKHGHSYVVPSAPGRAQEIVVPRSQTSWLLEIPDRILSTQDAHSDVLYNSYQFFGMDDEFPINTMHKHLARNLMSLIPGIQDEVEGAIDATFGKDSENWTSLNLWQAWLGMVPRVTNRIIVGAPVCRNPTFLANLVSFADDIIRNGFLLTMFPTMLHPIVGRLAVLPNRWHAYRAYRVCKPVILQRLHDMTRQAAGDPAYDAWEPEEGFVTWLIRQAMAEGLREELDPHTLFLRLLPIEFAAIHTTVITGHSLLLDLLSADPALGYLDIIREETSRVLAEEGGQWTKSGLARLHRTDSAIRESMRLSIFAPALTHRKVVAKEGITNPAEGWRAPYGSFLMLNLAGTHHDADLYEDPQRYDALRFSRLREEFEAREKAGRAEPDEAMRAKRLGMVTTSDEFLPFSHGRHACPGRFFVAHELKMILAYLVQNYDIQPIPERPKNMWMGQTVIPPLSASIQVKRRKATAAAT
ncbi:cytochrome P450 [Cercophora scortea]|uniref:Cytochrome P450 n=1 Tax=Cercophora scortea TaxID=314031 RepID=A0AAE0MIF1_9PEZI|nr:cytochrome P450 [Cercophora scortea]